MITGDENAAQVFCPQVSHQFDLVRAEALEQCCKIAAWGDIDEVELHRDVSNIMRGDVEGVIRAKIYSTIRALSPDGWLAEHDRLVRLEELQHRAARHDSQCERDEISDHPTCMCEMRRIAELSTPSPKGGGK